VPFFTYRFYKQLHNLATGVCLIITALNKGERKGR